MIVIQQILLAFLQMAQLNKSIQPLNLNDNQECNCFDYTRNPHQYFLLKNRKEQQRQRPSNPVRPEHNASTQTIKFSSQKRSLKKSRQPVCQSPPNNRDTNVYTDYYSPPRKDGRMELEDIRQTAPSLQRDTRNIQYQQAVRQQYFREVELPARQPALVKSFSTQNLPASPYFSRPIQMPILNGSINLSSPHKPQLSPRISFKVQKISQPATLSPRERVEPYISPVVNIKYETTNVPNIYEQNKHQFDLKIKEHSEITGIKIIGDKSVRQKKTQYRSAEKQSPVQNKQKHYQAKLSSLKEQNYQSIIRQDPSLSSGELGRYRQNAFSSFRSRIDTKKSRIQQGQVKKSKINMKKLRYNKDTLHKMNDVEEIRSMMDSDEDLNDESKQSFVLARLIDKTSFMDPSVSASDSNPTLHSKIGYSTSAGKSTLKAFDYSPFQ